MKYAASAAVMLAAGIGLATVAQAQGTYGQGGANTPTANPPSATSSATMPNGGSSAAMPGTAADVNQQAAAPAPAPMHRRLAVHARVSRVEVKQAQEQLKSQGLYRGPIDGVMGHRTRASIGRFQQRNGLHRTARLDQNTLAQLTGGSQTGRVGSSMSTKGIGSSTPPAVLRGTPANRNGMTPPANPTPNGAGGSDNTPTGSPSVNH